MADNEQDELNNQLKAAQGKHLRAIENWARQQPQVAGIPILQTLTYDLIQVTNQAYLNAILSPPQPEGQQRTEAVNG
jgi:hypothetical protein